jgi:predicted dehydrogenase
MNAPSPYRPRVGLVGVSGYARIHLDLIRNALAEGLVDFRAAVVINPAEEAEVVAGLKAAGVRVYGAFEEFLQAESGHLDLCCVPTGIALHAPMTVAALHAGMNVLVEKPLAGSLQDADRIIAAEQQSGKFVAVGFQDMYTQLIRWLKGRILDGAIGRLEEVRFLGMWPRDSSYYARNKWAGKVAVDGVAVLDSPLNNAFGHFPHLALFLAGTGMDKAAPARLIDGQLLRVHAIESFDTAVIRADSPTGVRFWFGASHACETDQNPEIRIIGSAGEVDWKYEESCRLSGPGGTLEAYPAYTAFGAREEMFRAVLQRLHDPRRFISTPEMARLHTALIESIHERLPIIDVDPQSIATIHGPAGNAAPRLPVIKGIESALRAAFDTGSPVLLNEATSTK